jgi:hypothetical protein
MIFSQSNPPPGFYVYLYLRKDGTPYYVGKGKKLRAWATHIISTPKSDSQIKIVAAKLLEKEALLLEVKLIEYYGRKDLGTGILRNMTDGGDGVSGYQRSDELKKKQSEWVTKSNEERLLNKTHTFLDKDAARQRNYDRMAAGTYFNPWYETNPNNQLISCLYCRTVVGIPNFILNHGDKCIHNPNNTLPECPHCHIRCSAGNYKRWHDDKCKKLFTV